MFINDIWVLDILMPDNNFHFYFFVRFLKSKKQYPTYDDS